MSNGIVILIIAVSIAILFVLVYIIYVTYVWGCVYYDNDSVHTQPSVAVC